MGSEEHWLPWLFLASAPATCPNLLATGSLLGESCGTQTRNARKQPWEAAGSVSRSGSASRAPRPAAWVLSPVLVPQSRWVLGFSFPETQKLLPPAPWQLPWGRERSKSSSGVPPGLPHGTSPAPPPAPHRAPPHGATSPCAIQLLNHSERPLTVLRTTRQAVINIQSFFFVGIFMKFYHHLPWLVMALFMYGLHTWLCSLSKHNSITACNCSISAVLSARCSPAPLLNGQGRY